MDLPEILAIKNNNQINQIWETWEPTLTWSTAIPDNVVCTAKYKKIGKTIFYCVHITADDGNGATNLYVSLPFTPKTNNLDCSYAAYRNVGGNSSTAYAKLYDDGVVDKLGYIYLGTLNDGQSVELSMNGFYEID